MFERKWSEIRKRAIRSRRLISTPVKVNESREKEMKKKEHIRLITWIKWKRCTWKQAKKESAATRYDKLAQCKLVKAAVRMEVCCGKCCNVILSAEIKKSDWVAALFRKDFQWQTIIKLYSDWRLNKMHKNGKCWLWKWVISKSRLIKEQSEYFEWSLNPVHGGQCVQVRLVEWRKCIAPTN